MKTRLRDAQVALDRAVGEAYRHGLPREICDLEPLPLLFALNRQCAAAEKESTGACRPSAPATAGSRATG